MPPKGITAGRITKSTRLKSKPATQTALRKTKTSLSKTPSSIMSTSTSSPPAEASKTGPVYFWKPNQGHGYLGQWYPSEFTYEGDTYATAEMWMMVQKARLFEDEGVAKMMLETRDPKQHKALGRQVKGFEQKKWDQNKLRIVEEGNLHKFTISEDAANLRSMLMSTEDRELVEASPMDRIWGVGFGEKNAGNNRHRWGQNLLGKALMTVREKLKEDRKEKKTEGNGV